MLELVGRSAGTPQVVYLTDDQDVAAWARMEAVAGDLTSSSPALAGPRTHRVLILRFAAPMKLAPLTWRLLASAPDAAGATRPSL